MNVVIFGATGYSGKEILRKVLSENHHVSVLVRNAAAIPFHHTNLTVVEGNVMDTTVVHTLLEGKDAVIQCLGIGGKGDGKPSTFISDASAVIVEAMQNQNVKRLIAMSNVGAGSSVVFQPWIFRKIILPYFMKWLHAIIEDKNRMEPVIMNSNLDWTIVRCPNITDKPARKNIVATLDGKGLGLSITNQDTASFIVRQLFDDTFSRQAPSISN
ncbi:MAG: NAD(P)-dependent oxidoreductase [Candidatus Kapaibacteriota bacterium]|jgi:uncharacterized protein YbjT (DUF2867 family)